MNMIRKGAVYTASKKRFGKNEKSDWEMLTVTDEKGHNPIAIFVSNRPSGINEGETFRINEINDLTVKTRKDEKGTWWTDVSVNASVTPVKTLNEYNTGTDVRANTFSTDDVETESELPF